HRAHEPHHERIEPTDVTRRDLVRNGEQRDQRANPGDEQEVRPREAIEMKGHLDVEGGRPGISLRPRFSGGEARRVEHEERAREEHRQTPATPAPDTPQEGHDDGPPEWGEERHQKHARGCVPSFGAKPDYRLAPKSPCRNERQIPTRPRTSESRIENSISASNVLALDSRCVRFPT